MEASEQVLDANARHMQTEKRRRDRIANGFETLRELLPYQDRRMDKATFLQEVVEYVRQLQVCSNLVAVYLGRLLGSQYTQFDTDEQRHIPSIKCAGHRA